jgi:hypothetical protein
MDDISAQRRLTASEHGSAKRPDRPVLRHRPAGTSDATVAALGKLGEAVETVEHARGLLYGFHRLCGSADLALQDAVAQLHAAGHGELAAQIDEVLVGRDVIDGRWSFELVEAYDTQYWQVVREVCREARERAGVFEEHLFEAEMKHHEQGGPGS